MLWICDSCTTRYAPGLSKCPHCGSAGYTPDHEQDAAAAHGLAGEAPQSPAKSAAKADWVAHAASLGWTSEAADALTKDDLIAALAKSEGALMKLKCRTCGHQAEIEAVSAVWKCNCHAGTGPAECDCDATNTDEGAEQHD